ncbi:MAG TPA: LapA family protein [Trueperaceae bacterium]
MRRQPLDASGHKSGYALGTALAFVPLVGIPVRFAVQEIPAPLVYAGALLLGAVIGWLFAPPTRQVAIPERR